ncbi:hypothetical protein KKC22_05955 [Myxococcota bacterium]|nr:hypothetical protein [Myxococcota bacterium]
MNHDSDAHRRLIRPRSAPLGGALLLLAWLSAFGCDFPAGKRKNTPYVPPAVCAEAAVLPKLPAIWIDDAHSLEYRFDDSDVAMDPEGNLVSVDGAGNVLRRAHDGTITVLAEGVVRTARGLAYLSTGELVIADSGRGMLVLVYPDGQSRILVPHLDFPNGLVVDRDDTIYVSESSRGAVSRVHPRTGQLVTVVTGLPMSPGGLSFSPDYLTLYVVGSDSSIHAITRDAMGHWGSATLFATVPGAGSTCEGLSNGDSCTDNGLWGTCRSDGLGDLYCFVSDPCAGLEAGAPCSESGTPGTCTDNGEGALYCNPTPACDGKVAGDPCNEYGSDGICTDNGGGALYCVATPACYGLVAGDVCVEWGYDGICTDDGAGSLYCYGPTACDGKAAGDRCLSWAGVGTCVDDGYGYLGCTVPPACEGKNAGDACMEYGSAGICIDDGYGYLWCQTLPACEGKSAGDACTEGGIPGLCTDDGEGGLGCALQPICTEGAQAQTCPGADGLPGFCMDDISGSPYCQSPVLCEGLDVGDTCIDSVLGRVGVCATVAGGVVCQLHNPCALQGQECELFDGRYGGGGGASADAEDRMMIEPGSRPGTCELSADGLLACMPRSSCWGLAAGDACVTDWGNRGTCIDDGQGVMVCADLFSCEGLGAGDTCLTAEGEAGTCVDDGQGTYYCTVSGPCDGLAAGDACAFGTDGNGVCADTGSGALFCRPEPACTGKSAGDACTNPADGLPGTCMAAAGDLLVCAPTPPCADKNPGDTCTAAGGFPGTCADAGQGGALFCDSHRPVGRLHAVATDACGNVYVSEARTRTLWRFTPEGSPELVASDLRGPVTGLIWGSGAGPWDPMTLYASISGGAGVTSIPLGIPGRPMVMPLRSDTVPADLPTNLDHACLRPPDAPVAIHELVGPAGFHDVTWDDRGWIVGFNGADLVAVSQAGQVQPVATGIGVVEGLAVLPDGTIVAATDLGVISIAPSGARDTLAPDILSAYGVTVGPDGRIYVADMTRVYRIDPETRAVEVFLDPTDFSQNWQPRTIAFDQDASLMFIGSFGDSVYVAALDGGFNLVGVPRKLGRVVPDGMWLDALVVDACGNFYLPNSGTASLYRLSPDGRSRLYHHWDDGQKYGHGGDWGVAAGGWRTDAIYMPQPYDNKTVVEMVVGIPGAGR